MRILPALASLTLLVASGIGCGDTTTTTVIDMAVGADMSATPHDMMTLNCSQIAMCASSAGTAAGAGACLAEGKTTSQGKFTTMLGCAFTACGPTDGGGTGMCTGLTDSSTSCSGCVKGVITSGVTGGGACAAQVQACFADT